MVIIRGLTSENASRSRPDTGEVQRSGDVDRHFADDCDKVWDCGEAIRYSVAVSPDLLRTNDLITKARDANILIKSTERGRHLQANHRSLKLFRRSEYGNVVAWQRNCRVSYAYRQSYPKAICIGA